MFTIRTLTLSCLSAAETAPGVGMFREAGGAQQTQVGRLHRRQDVVPVSEVRQEVPAQVVRHASPAHEPQGADGGDAREVRGPAHLLSPEPT